MTGRQSCQETAAGVRKAVGRCMHCSRIVRTEWDEKQSSNVEEIKTVVRLLDEWLADPNGMTIVDAVGFANDSIAHDIRDSIAQTLPPVARSPGRVTRLGLSEKVTHYKGVY